MRRKLAETPTKGSGQPKRRLRSVVTASQGDPGAWLRPRGPLAPWFGPARIASPKSNLVLVARKL